jgi:hypothetical protein
VDNLQFVVKSFTSRRVDRHLLPTTKTPEGDRRMIIQPALPSPGLRRLKIFENNPQADS